VANPFSFLQAEWPPVYEAATKAAAAAYPDPRASCFYARRALELAVAWAYKHDAALQLPYQDNLSALVHEPTFKAVAGEAVFAKARAITQLGNQAVHSNRTIQQADSIAAVRELFHVGWWLAHTYARGQRPAPGLAFDANALPRTTIPKQTLEQLRDLHGKLRDSDEKLTSVLADKAALEAELVRVRAEIAEAKKAAAAVPDAHDYDEQATRDLFIDMLLKEAGWPLDQPRDREFEVSGMPNNKGKGFVDYVLWGDDARPLAVVEAKRTRRDSRVGQEQARLYANCLEQRFGVRPVIFYTNGYEHWIWDDASYPASVGRAIQAGGCLDLALGGRPPGAGAGCRRPAV
jgi:type I restriction enzyme R subunit